MHIVLVLFLTFFSSFLSANSKDMKVVGKVESLVGKVKVKHDSSFRKKIVKQGLEIKEGDLITTTKKSSAVIRLVDKSVVVVDSNSAIYFGKDQKFLHSAGKVYYKMTSRNSKNALAIKTPFAIIGIKGTTFIIDAKKQAKVTLKEGLIGVKSIDVAFKLYREKEKKEFNKYKHTEENQFKEYQKHESKHTIKYVKEFDLKSGNSLSFDGKEVKETKLNKKDKAEFSYYENLIIFKK